MIRSIQRFFEKKIRPARGVTTEKATEDSLKLATAALLIEAAKADTEIRDAEVATVTSAIRKTFGISKEQTAELMDMAGEHVSEAASFYPFTRLINKGFSYEEKKHVVELLWRVVFADSEMEKHEEHFVRRVANLLHVSHEDFIETKQRERARSQRRG
ncbi:MAG: TerB family tellurite resistance protein [Thermodesulfobacteriota bacterium]